METMIKNYEGNSSLFAIIPKEISRVLSHDFRELLQSDSSTITEHDSLEIPSGIVLFDPDPKIGSEQLDTSDSLSAGKNTPHPFQELKDEFEPDQDKNLTSPDKLTPPLQGKETDLLNQDFNDFTLDKPGQSHDNPDPGTDPDETALMNKLQQLSKDDLHDDLLELENESFPVEVTEGKSDESD